MDTVEKKMMGLPTGKEGKFERGANPNVRLATENCPKSGKKNGLSN